MEENTSKDSAPVGLQLIAIAVILGFTILYGLGIHMNSLGIKAGGFVGNILSVIVLINLSFRKGRAKEL